MRTLAINQIDIGMMNDKLDRKERNRLAQKRHRAKKAEDERRKAERIRLLERLIDVVHHAAIRNDLDQVKETTAGFYNDSLLSDSRLSPEKANDNTITENNQHELALTTEMSPWSNWSMGFNVLPCQESQYCEPFYSLPPNTSCGVAQFVPDYSLLLPGICTSDLGACGTSS